MAITELFATLEKAVEDAQAKSKVLATAESAHATAQKNYNDAVANVEKLKTELTSKIGDILPSSRIRQAS